MIMIVVMMVMITSSATEYEPPRLFQTFPSLAHICLPVGVYSCTNFGVFVSFIVNKYYVHYIYNWKEIYLHYMQFVTLYFFICFVVL